MENRWENEPDDGREVPDDRFGAAPPRFVPLQRTGSVSGAPSVLRAPTDSPASRRRSEDTPRVTPGCDDLTPESSGWERGLGSAAPWAVLAPGNAASIDTRHQRVSGCIRQVGELASGEWVVLLDDGPLCRARLRRIAHGGGLFVVRELIVVPTVDDPRYLVDDLEWAQSRRSLQRVRMWSWVGAINSGRVLIARRR